MKISQVKNFFYNLRVVIIIYTISALLFGVSAVLGFSRKYQLAGFVSLGLMIFVGIIGFGVYYYSFGGGARKEKDK